MYDFTYSCPTSLSDALLLLKHDETAQPLSGGQTLMPVLRARLAAPSQLVDLARLPELKGIKVEGGRLVIGGAETHAAVAASHLVQTAIPALASLAGGIGDVQVRHRGTIGGSVANNDPAACYPSAVLGLDADVVTSKRCLSANDFLTGMFSTALEPGEIVTGLSFPVPSSSHYEKFKNPASRFALIGVFAARTAQGTRIAITGSGSGVFRWFEAEAHVDSGGSDNVSGIALDDSHYTSDLHGSAEYRMHLTRIVTARALAHIGR
ncbi:FAD binding domain-containing protein [Aquisediminimonas profunda]|uniref:FAD binding domain-containing protein n=1 Tax=Aquisediminimonas profunda TaxID=1550733 RepID=UPI001C63545D|nr:xanthine dehydrogenase family protein subunit M [Aquisediminimonas profunda]